jgi:hypothetical protein
MRSCSYARASSNGQRSDGESERRVRWFMRRRKTKTVVRLGSLGMSNRAFQVGLRHAALPPGFSAFPWLHGWSLSSLDQRDSPANPGTTQRVGNDLPPQQQLCDVDAVVVMSIRARKSGKTIVYTDCAAAERSLSAAGQPLLPCRARVVAEQLLVQYVQIGVRK